MSDCNLIHLFVSYDSLTVTQTHPQTQRDLKKPEPSSPFPSPHQSLRSPQPAGAVSASPSASWPPWLAAPIAASCGLSGSPWSPSAAGSLLEPASRSVSQD